MKPLGGVEFAAYVGCHQANVKVCQSEINERHGTELALPLTYYRHPMTVAYGGTAKETGFDGDPIEPVKLQQMAARE